MSKIIIYATKCGSSEQYAKKLSEIMRIKCYNIKSLKSNILEGIEGIIYIAPIRMNKIYKFSKFYEWYNIEDIKITPICIGLTPHNEEYIEFIKEKNFKNLRNVDNIYYLRGAFDKTKLSFLDRCLVNMIVNNIEKKDVLTQNEKMIYDMLSHNSDYIDYDILENIAYSIE